MHFNLSRALPSRVFVALNLHNSAAILPSMTSELIRTLSALCQPISSSSSSSLPPSLCPNVFVSIYESDSSDTTAASLDLFDLLLTSLSIPHLVSAHNRLPPPTSRIDHLTTVRNFALAPFTSLASSSSAPPYDFILFLNDVLFCAEDAIRLLSLSQVTGAQMVCGLDFDEWGGRGKASFYDSWVMRDRAGGKVSKAWPFLREEFGGREVRGGLPLPAFCCWNGLVVMTAREWWEWDLQFRAHDDVEEGKCEASECSHVCEDYHAIHGGQALIIVDPTVHVAYERQLYEDIERQEWWVEQQHRRMQSDEERLAEARRLFSGQEQVAKQEPREWECCDLAGHCSSHAVQPWKRTARRLESRQSPQE